MKLGTVVASFVLLGLSCAVVPAPTRQGASGPPGAPSDADTSAVFALDRTIHDPVEAPSGIPCGASRCDEGQFCCNESCGVCAARGDLCLQRQCGPEAPAVTQCVCDDDCRAVSNYCEGCQCLPMGAVDLDPACHGQIVACFLDPCRQKHASCLNGGCALVND